ncbi:hypothetical protein [Burkholderia sp. Ac-20379]|uniref:hypothetical protein n=1 Tax=Burkholderia sp. Ac-20379 TaxID=2703900 RepID=UPI00197CFB13|nr:hypothetical protein [Burkholderia sp. Ac-20379]MBN3728384.1 hypothetical protein [Burkholderia sp. Ac-20379]
MSIQRAWFSIAILLFSGIAEAQQVGVVESGVYYSVNPALPKGTRVQVLSDDDSGNVQCCGEIAGPAKHAGRQVLDSLRDRPVTAYALTTSGALSADSSGFGIAGNVKMVKQGAHPQAVLADGSHLNFSTCASAEGVHYLGRRAGDNKLLVHLYEYFDGDLESNCKDSELK